MVEIQHVKADKAPLGRFAHFTHKGNSGVPRNQDVILALPQHNLYGVIDGMGGDGGRGGEAAANFLRNKIREEAGNLEGASEAEAHEWMKGVVNQTILDLIQNQWTEGAAYTIVHVRPEEAVVMQAGDVQLYKQNKHGEITHVSSPHRDEQGKLTHAMHPRHLLPGDEEGTWDAFKTGYNLPQTYTIPLEEGDRITILSDGVWEEGWEANTDTLEDRLTANIQSTAQEAVHDLIQLTRGTSMDNQAAVVFDRLPKPLELEVYEEPKQEPPVQQGDAITALRERLERVKDYLRSGK